MEDPTDSAEPFRAVVTCSECGIVVWGPWSTGDRALAAYLLGLDQEALPIVVAHLQKHTGGVSVAFETPTGGVRSPHDGHFRRSV